ncbi:MAG TPA: nitroreductase family protein [Bacteroidales bacterium]|nr:nitroreductase family protein [Bacteroidales bacterium]
MKAPSVSLNASLCKKCRICTEICPNLIFRFYEGEIHCDDSRLPLCIGCGQCMAACSSQAIQIEGIRYGSEIFPLAQETVSDAGFVSLLESRRSVRSFLDKDVPEELLRDIVDSIAMAPPSFPPVKISLSVVKNRETMERLLPHMVGLYDNMVKGLKHPVAKHMIRRKMGAEKYRLVKNHLLPILNAKLPSMKAGTENAITRGAPAMIVFHAHSEAENAATDTYIALGFALLRAHSLKLGATCVDLIAPAINKVPLLKELLQIPEQHTAIAAIIVGYPKYRFRNGIRRSLQSVVFL